MNSQINDPNGTAVSILGHGGMGSMNLYPMNSFESIDNCIKLGADGSEMDVQLTKDNVLVLYHHRYLEESTTSSGPIAFKTWVELSGAEYKSLLSGRPKLVAVSELLDKTHHQKSHTFTFDCKLYETSSAEYWSRFADALNELIIKYDLVKTATIESTEPGFLKMLQDKNMDLKLFVYVDDFNEGFKIAREMGFYGITMDMDKISREQISSAHQNHLKIALFNQRSKKDNLRAIEMLPDYIQTDKLEHLLKQQNKYIR